MGAVGLHFLLNKAAPKVFVALLTTLIPMRLKNWLYDLFSEVIVR